MQHAARAVGLVLALIGGCTTPEVRNEPGLDEGGDDVHALTDDDCIVVARPHQNPTSTLNVTALAQNRTYQMELAGRTSVFLRGGSNPAPFELMEAQSYDFVLAPKLFAKYVVAEIRKTGEEKILWTSNLRKVDDDLANPDKQAVGVRSGYARDVVEFHRKGYRVWVEIRK